MRCQLGDNQEILEEVEARKTGEGPATDPPLAGPGSISPAPEDGGGLVSCVSSTDAAAGEDAPPQSRQVPGEVVKVYRSNYTSSREVVKTYIQPRRMPGRAAEAPPKSQLTLPEIDQLREMVANTRPVQKKPQKRSRKGLWIFLGCVLVLLVLTGTAVYLSSDVPDEEDPGVRTEEDYTAAVSIETYPFGEGATMDLQRRHGQELTIQEVYQTVNPAVVTVMAQLDYGMSVGTGVIFREDGYLFTNYHVVAGSDACDVTLASGKTYEAKYVGGDSDNDIAVLKVNAEGLPTAEMGDSDALTVGDTVYAIGNPLGVELRGTLTDGIVSAINRDVRVEGRTMTLIQTNAALNEGNSGGPLINVYGQVVGINTIKMMSFTSSVEGLGFALPMATVERMVNNILECGKVRPEPLLGVSVLRESTTLPDGTEGVEVLSVAPDSPAEKAGLQVGDVIVSAAGRSAAGQQALLRIRRQFDVGDEMPVTVWRDGAYLEFTLVLDQAAE